MIFFLYEKLLAIDYCYRYITHLMLPISNFALQLSENQFIPKIAMNKTFFFSVFPEGFSQFLVRQLYITLKRL